VIIPVRRREELSYPSKQICDEGKSDIEKENDVGLANKPSDHIPNAFPNTFSPVGSEPYLKESIDGDTDGETNEEYGNTPGRKFPDYHKE
jgi:hypothetical protein